MPLKPIKTKDRLDKVKHNPEKAVEYAFETIKGPWPEAEPFIMKHGRSAFLYALHVLKHRWPEAEPFIKKHKIMWSNYRVIFKIKG